ncbi:MAG: LysR family transcriptional regulator [Akkermansiaceae bacterium]|nr:LysR family transcriptional regulator [Akkermansiaceae bacterium]
MNLSIKQLHYFTHAAKLENISAAAAQLGITQPTLSSALQKIEKDLDTQLFDRAGGHISLNTAGQMLLPRVKQLLTSFLRVAHAAEAIRAMDTDAISMSIPSCPWTHSLRSEISGDPRIKLQLPSHPVTSAGVSLIESDLSILCQYAPRPAGIGYQYTDIIQIPGLCSATATTAPKDPPSFMNLLIPSGTLVYGIKGILQSRQAAEAGMTYRAIQELPCFDHIAATCLGLNDIGIFPGPASMWTRIFGNLLRFQDMEPFKEFSCTISLVSSNNTDPALVEEMASLCRKNMTTFMF